MWRPGRSLQMDHKAAGVPGTLSRCVDGGPCSPQGPCLLRPHRARPPADGCPQVGPILIKLDDLSEACKRNSRFCLSGEWGLCWLSGCFCREIPARCCRLELHQSDSRPHGGSTPAQCPSAWNVNFIPSFGAPVKPGASPCGLVAPPHPRGLSPPGGVPDSGPTVASVSREDLAVVSPGCALISSPGYG